MSWNHASYSPVGLGILDHTFKHLYFYRKILLKKKSCVCVALITTFTCVKNWTRIFKLWIIYIFLINYFVFGRKWRRGKASELPSFSYKCVTMSSANMKCLVWIFPNFSVLFYKMDLNQNQTHSSCLCGGTWAIVPPGRA